MAIQSFQLDPNAATYTDDQIVGKVNSATSKVNADSVEDGTTNKVFTSTDETKLTGIDTGATVDQTGTEIQTAILGLSDADRKLIKTNPQTSEFTVLAIQRASDGKLDIDYEGVAV